MQELLIPKGLMMDKLNGLELNTKPIIFTTPLKYKTCYLGHDWKVFIWDASMEGIGIAVCKKCAKISGGWVSYE